MKNAFSTTLLAGAFVATSALSAFAGGCSGWGHSSDVSASVETQSIPEQVAEVVDDNQILDTGMISVARIDCTANADADECNTTADTLSN